MIDYRLRRTATTEVARTFNRQTHETAKALEPAMGRQETSEETVRRDGTVYDWVVSSYLYWSATLDRRTCDFCSSQDGERAPVEEGFSGGQPGEVHSQCRCIAVPTYDIRRVTRAGSILN